MDKTSFDTLLSEIHKIIDTYKSKDAVIKQYFEIGKRVIESQNGFPSKEELLKALSNALGERYGKANLSDMRRLYEIYKDYPAQFELAQNLKWSINRTLLRIDADIELRNELLQFASANKNISEKAFKNKLVESRGRKEIEFDGLRLEYKPIETKKYRSLGHADIAEIFIENGFDIQDSDCKSAQYFGIFHQCKKVLHTFFI